MLFKLSFENMKKMYKTLKGYREAKKIIREFKPDVVIGTGGYICGPVIMAAKKLKLPTMLHESNAYPGKAVKMFAKEVDCVLVGFEEAKERLSEAKRVVVTGTPTKIKKLTILVKKKKKKKLNNLEILR